MVQYRHALLADAHRAHDVVQSWWIRSVEDTIR
jgi:hypothetical protein